MIIKLILILGIMAGVVVLFIYFALKEKKLSPQNLAFIQTQWKLILKESESDSKQSILEADKLLNFILSRKGYEGSLGEKLKKASPLFSDLDGVWRAHKLRNKIAHELNFSPASLETKQALFSFKKAFFDLDVPL